MQEVGQLGDTVVSARFVPLRSRAETDRRISDRFIVEAASGPFTPVSLTAPKPYRHPPSCKIAPIDNRPFISCAAPSAHMVSAEHREVRDLLRARLKLVDTC